MIIYRETNNSNDHNNKGGEAAVNVHEMHFQQSGSMLQQENLDCTSDEPRKRVKNLAQG